MTSGGGIALVCGNGLSLSRVSSAGSDLDPRRPLRWDLLTPGRESKLIDDLPGLKQWLSENDPGEERNDYPELIIPFSARLSPDTPVPQDLPDDELAAFLDLAHYLTVAYSWFQLDLDRHPLTGWSWLDWCERHRSRVRAVLSWNYDLVMERLLFRSGLPFRYAGINSGVIGARKGIGRRRAALVAKPHGSCNFAPDGVIFNSAEFDGDPGEPMTYPRLVHISGYDGPIRALPDREIYSIRQVADVVLPGEQNRFGRYLGWVQRSWAEFVAAANDADQLIVVGFSMAEADRPEFERMVAQLPSVRRITVVDPSPSPALLEVLRPIGELICCDDIGSRGSNFA